MSNKTIFATGALAFLLVGCTAIAQQPPRSTTGNQQLKPVRIVDVPPATKHPIDRYSAANCIEVRCHFTVRVSGDCQIVVDPQWMGISRRNKTVTLVWELKDSPGYAFATDSVFNKPREGDVINPFEGARVLRADIVEAPFKNNPGHVAEYGIRIAKDGKVCGTLDPPVFPDI